MPLINCEPPGYLTPAQRALWAYYEPQLVAEGRLPLKARDVLAKYIIALDVVARLNEMLTKALEGDEKPVLTELRHWLMVTRLYESDLLLNPAAAIRAPKTADQPTDLEDEELADILN